MYLKRLDIHGFKSFAEPVSLEFLDGITCIVGPNGSGKSNISDAVRWVLGEQSPKTLRGGKMEEVIFAGTESRRPRGLAEVTLVIDNGENILPADYSEVAITRRMYRSGESEYAINNIPCRLKDIRELIMDTGMGVEGYSIIGQGRIAEIINSKADGRRAMFEEAAGIVKYRIRKGEAEKKLLNAAGNLDRVNDILGEIEGRIDGLRSESEKAQEYLSVSREYKNLEINITIRQVENIEKKTEGLKEEIRQGEELALSLQKEKENLEEKQRSAKEQIAFLESCLSEKRQAHSRAADDCNEMKRVSQIAGEKLASLKRDRRRLEEERLLLEQKLAKCTEERNGFTEEKERLKQERQSRIDSFSQLEKDYKKASGEAEKSYHEIEEKRSLVFDLYNGLTAGRTELSGLETLQNSLFERREQIQEKMRDSRRQSEGLKQEADCIKQDLLFWEQKEKEAQGKLSQLFCGMEETEKAVTLCRKKETEIRNEYHRVKTKKELLESFEQGYEGFGPAVRFIMNRKQQLKGIRGAVADLIRVPEGLEAAFQTALGQSVQNIVCDRDETASRAVELLKAERAGRATFLPVESIRGGRSLAHSPQMQSLRQEKGFIGFAAELAEYDSQYQAVMEYLLGRIIVAETLKDGLRFSKKYEKGARFVTPEGDDINSSGAITGGRTKQNYPNVLQRKNELKALAERELLLHKEKQDCAARLEGLLLSLEEKKKKRQKWEEELTQCREKRLQVSAALERKLDQDAILSENAQRWEKELLEIRQQAARTDTMMGNLREEVDRKSHIISGHESFVKNQMECYEGKKKQVEQMAEAISQHRVVLSSFDRELRYVNEAIEKNREEEQGLIREREDKILGIDQTGRQEAILEQQIMEAEKRLEETEAELLEQEEAVRQMEQRRGQLTEQSQCLSEEKERLDVEMLRIQTAKHELELKVTKQETQTESLKNKLWDTFELAYVSALSLRTEPFALSSAVNQSRQLRNRMRELEPVHIGAIQEYKEVSERYIFLKEQKKDLTEAIEGLESVIADMDKTIRASFKESFGKISKEFESAFTQLFGGGFAQLRPEREDFVLEGGIDIIAQPPGKKLQNINLLSGGEKSLTAIALMCAFLKVRPTPFCILDEVEAALDDLNIGRFIHYLKNFNGVQFLIVTHQKATMEQADVMYGITMPEQGISKVISLKLGDIDTFAKKMQDEERRRQQTGE